MSGTEFQRAKESAADIMRQKQAACEFSTPLLYHSWFFFTGTRSHWLPQSRG
ncbi:4f5 domain protein [Colletotrichum plurivorum]|uniref:4f5 domain protein n=1 Tax=Colletotrichum plurivorum TaxID=2175906 RepID=A0A8H6NQ21_9PEZI|nr:4f5 domain protein [Colletotrichum plurivorum]